MKRMKRSGLFFGIVGSAALVVLAASAVACNGLLGIQSATLGEGLDAGPPAEAGVTCPYYCQTITTNCAGNDNQEYQGDMQLCLDMCNNLGLDQGFLSDKSGNTLGCRVHYAQLAASDPTTNCRFAGPLGGGQCGSKTDACGNFCQLDVTYCASSQVNTPSYLSMADCNNSCLVTGSTGDGGTGYVFTTDGGSTGVDLPDGTNTLNCRYYHLENAYPSVARGKLHCPHTMPISGPCQ